jgi:hypothetical protein
MFGRSRHNAFIARDDLLFLARDSLVEEIW